MNPALLAAGAIAAGMAALAIGGKKKKEAKLLAAGTAESGETTRFTGEVQVPIAVIAPPTASPAKAAPTFESGVQAIAKEVLPGDVNLSEIMPPPPTAPITAASPGWPPISGGTGAGITSGATSIAKNGAVDSAFDELVATAIAKGDLAALRDLAMQAQYRGLTDVAESIRAEIARLTQTAPPPTPAVQPTPIVAPVSSPLGRATISQSAGSRGPDVVEWQRIIGVARDGIFGPITDKATRAWQKAHPPLVVDGIVGPKTWTAAYAVQPALATTPRVVTAPEVTTTATKTTSVPATIKVGSRGETVKQWQGIIGVTKDGIFGPITEARTKDWQRARPPLAVDGIVGPLTWTAAFTGVPAPVTTVAPVPSAPAPTPIPTPTVSLPESDARMAARELTQYLSGLGGLAGRYKENRNQVKTYQSRMGILADGMYGRGSASAVIANGLIPVVPYYWPSTGTAAAKSAFTSMVQGHANTDPARRAEWDKLLSDIQRA